MQVNDLVFSAKGFKKNCLFVYVVMFVLLVAVNQLVTGFEKNHPNTVEQLYRFRTVYYVVV